MHHDLSLLKDILIIFMLSVGVLYICHRVKVHAIVGLLITGVVVGPNGFKLIQAISEVEILAELGVMMLLFTIGIEFSLKHLFKMYRMVLIGGGLQVLLTIVVTALISKFTGMVWPKAIYIGFLFSLSSTAIVLKLLQESSQINSRSGQAVLGILIFLRTSIMTGLGLHGVLGKKRI